MFTDFIKKQLKAAKYKLLKDGSYFGHVPALRGVWANAKTFEACRVELQEVLEDWLVLQLRDRRKVSGLHAKTTKIKNMRAPHYA